MAKCKHGRNDMFCVDCRYHRNFRGQSEKIRTPGIKELHEIPEGRRISEGAVMLDDTFYQD